MVVAMAARTSKVIRERFSLVVVAAVAEVVSCHFAREPADYIMTRRRTAVVVEMPRERNSIEQQQDHPRDIRLIFFASSTPVVVSPHTPSMETVVVFVS